MIRNDKLSDALDFALDLDSSPLLFDSEGNVTINGRCLNLSNNNELALLRLLTNSKRLQFELNELKKRIDLLLNLTPDEELCEAAVILSKHMDSGFIEGYDCDDFHGLVWHWAVEPD